MANVLKSLVSKNKKRHMEGEFNLDLSYITSQIIAMGFPADRWEGIYRNNIDDVVKFLDSKHGDKYMVYNLCKERSYGAEKFHLRVQIFPFEDHNPPSLRLIHLFCQAVHNWLACGPLFVAAVHCKAGKGRTGVMICCYLLHANHRPLAWQHKEVRPLSADQVLEQYAQLRTFNREGVTIPSQRRYVSYYEYQLGRDFESCDAVPLMLVSCKLHGGLPTVGNTNSTIYMIVHTQTINDEQAASSVDNAGCNGSGLQVGLHLSGVSCMQEVRRGACETVLFPADACVPLVVAGDVKVTLYCKPKLMKKIKLCQFWFNTYFVLHQCRTCCSLSSSSSSAGSKSSYAKGGSTCNIEHLESRLASYEYIEYASADCACPCHLLNESCSDKTVPLTLTLAKHQLDKAVKDKIHKIFPATFKVTLTFNRASKEDCERSVNMRNTCGSSMFLSQTVANSDLHSDTSLCTFKNTEQQTKVKQS